MMDQARLYRKLIAAARAQPPGNDVPYAFEKRVMALIAGQSATSPGSLWAQALWRGALACVAFVIFFSALTLVLPQKHPANDLSQDFEKTMLAAVGQDGESAW